MPDNSGAPSRLVYFDSSFFKAMGRKVYECSLIVLALLLIESEAITVSPALCPTNKIAPHKRHANWQHQYGTARTFGAFYDLLVPGGYGHVPYGPINDDDSLQEQPQEDDPGDCGEIEDYDENDLSSVTPQDNRRQGSTNRHFFGPPQNNRPPNYPERPPHRPPNYPQRPPNYPERPPNYPERPPNYPQRPPNSPQRPPNYPQRPPNYPERPPRPPARPTRPPYWSGGLFGSNDYRPPLQQYPSDNIKPIHEYSDNNGVSYSPTLVGGSLNQVIGVSPIVPTTEAPTPRPEFSRPELPPRGTSQNHPTPQRRPKSSTVSNRGVLGSFVDLFF